MPPADQRQLAAEQPSCIQSIAVKSAAPFFPQKSFISFHPDVCHHERGADALAGHISDSNSEPSLGQLETIIVVPTYLARPVVYGPFSDFALEPNSSKTVVAIRREARDF
jgi:hypothetical protein